MTRVAIKFWGHYFTLQKDLGLEGLLYKSTGTLGVGLTALNISDWSGNVQHFYLLFIIVAIFKKSAVFVFLCLTHIGIVAEESV